MNRDEIIIEKTLTSIYNRLCPSCREQIRPIIVKLGFKTADQFAGEVGITY